MCRLLFRIVRYIVRMLIMTIKLVKKFLYNVPDDFYYIYNIEELGLYNLLDLD